MSVEMMLFWLDPLIDATYRQSPPANCFWILQWYDTPLRPTMDRFRHVAGTVVVIGALAVVFAFQVAGAPGVSTGADPTPSPAASGSEDQSSLPAVVQAQLDALPPGTKIVDCLPGVPRLPQNVTMNRTAGFYQQRPGFHDLALGYCADDPDATAAPMRVDSVDGPQGETPSP